VKNAVIGSTTLQLPAATTDSYTDFTGDGWTFTEDGTSGTIRVTYAATGGGSFNPVIPAESGTLLTDATAVLAALKALAPAAGVLTNDGSDILSYTATSIGGQGADDDGKLVRFQSDGSIYAYTLGAYPGAGTQSTYVAADALRFNQGGNAVWIMPPQSMAAGIFYLRAPAITANATLITTNDTGTVTNAMLSGSIALSKLSTTGTANSGTYLRGDGAWTSISTGLTVGTTSIASGTTTRVLYNNAGALGEYTVSGSGSVAMTTSPTFTTPALGTPSAIVLTNATGSPTGISLTKSQLNTIVSDDDAAYVGTANTFSAAQTLSSNGALSIPALSITGTIITGGTATTTKPLVTLEVSGATSTNWSTSGTSLGINTASSFSGNYLDVQESGVRWARIYDNGNSYGTLGLSTSGGRETRIHGRFGTLVVSDSSSAAAVWIDGDSTGTGGGITHNNNNETTVYWNLQGDGVAGTIQMGSDASSPVSYTLKPGAATGTNAAGASMTLRGGASTGTGAGGDLVNQTVMSGSSGSSENSAQERARIIGRYKDLTEATATNLVSIALASGKVLGGTASVTVWAGDGTDCQALTSQVRFDAINKAGTVTATCTQTDNTTAASAGTLTVTYDATASGSNVLLRANATSSLTQTTLRARLVITALNGDDVQTITPQ
jgi:hypothetical protein